MNLQKHMSQNTSGGHSEAVVTSDLLTYNVHFVISAHTQQEEWFSFILEQWSDCGLCPRSRVMVQF